MKYETSNSLSNLTKDSAHIHRGLSISENVIVKSIQTNIPCNLLSSEIMELMPRAEAFKQIESRCFEKQKSNLSNTILLNAYAPQCYLSAKVSFNGLSDAEFVAECLQRNDAKALADRLIEYRKDIECYYSKYESDTENLVTLPPNKRLLDYTEEQIRDGITDDKKSNFNLIQFLVDESFHLFAEVNYSESTGITMNAGICEDAILMDVSIPLSDEEKTVLYSLICKEINLDKFPEVNCQAAHNSNHFEEYCRKKKMEFFDSFSYSKTYDSIPDMLDSFKYKLSPADNVKTEIYKIVPKPEYLEQLAQSNGYNQWATNLMIDNADRFMYIQQIDDKSAIINQVIVAKIEDDAEINNFSFMISHFYSETYQAFAYESKKEYSKHKNIDIER